MYRGLPCLYSSAILASASLLSGGNTVLLRTTAVALILFMVSRSFYPHDRVLESQNWKKAIYAGGKALFGWHILSVAIGLGVRLYVGLLWGTICGIGNLHVKIHFTIWRVCVTFWCSLILLQEKNKMKGSLIPSRN